MQTGSDGTTRKRAEGPEVALAREAMSAVLTVRNKIGPWQARVARLRGAQNHGPSQGSRDQVQADASALLDEIEGEQESLRRRAETLPNEVTSEGHFQDVVKAMSGIASAVGRLAPDRSAPSDTAPALLADAGPDRVLNLLMKCPGCGKASHLTVFGTPRADQRVNCPLCGTLIGRLDEIAAASRPAA